MANMTATMEHLTDETLLPYLDGELPAGERAEAEAHLARCAACRAALARVRSVSAHLSDALRAIDRPAPAIAVPRAAARRVRRLAFRSVSAGAWARAAALVIVAAGAAAAAVPGSPVREWVDRAFGAVAVRFGGGADRPELADAGPGDDASGIAVPLANGAIRVRLTRPSPDAIVRVRLVDGGRAAVRAPGARYRTGPGRIEVVEAGAGDIVIEVPRAAREARVEVDGRLAVLKEGTDLMLMTPAEDSTGTELRFRAGREAGTPP